MVIMNGGIRNGGLRWLIFLAALLPGGSLRADPIVDFGVSSRSQFGIIFTITIAILVEAVCILLLLRRRRTPRLFFLWLMAMHLLTYPIFLGLVWFSAGARPGLAAGICEGIIVLIEGSLIYLLCRFAPSAKMALPSPSVGKALFASLIGNICSAAAFPLLTLLNALLAHAIGGSGME